jgi:hypothetical protein
MAGVSVIPVQSKRDMKTFVDLPWELYRDDPYWIPPVKSQVIQLLTPGRHPFWTFSRRELFLALRGSEVVGRIAAIVDDHYNDYQQEKMGGWGFFECQRDPEAAGALFATAIDWLRRQGMEFIRGPLNPSMNYESGLLVHGFESRPTFLMTYNPPYYLELVKLSGFRKEKDLLTYLSTRDTKPPEWALNLGERLAQKQEVVVRKMNPKHFDDEVRLLTRLYLECWGHNWGFSPPTASEVRDMVQSIYPILDLDMAFFLYVQDEPMGVCVVLPDVTPLLKRFNGKLGLGALLKKHLYWSEINGCRGFILGVKEEYRQVGAPLVALHYLMEAAKDKPQYYYVELGWNLEDNQAINVLYEESGLRPHKRYRIYRRDLV